MAVYFELHRDGKPVAFSNIDEEMCARLHVDCHPVNYYKNWYDTIGFAIACGNSWDKIREFYPEKCDIIDFLEEEFKPISYGGR